MCSPMGELNAGAFDGARIYYMGATAGYAACGTRLCYCAASCENWTAAIYSENHQIFLLASDFAPV